MNRRERLERKVERRRGWAASRRTDADRRLNTARTMADGIPFGQPILVGHHSERRDRNFRERIRGNFEKAFESSNMAAHHTSKAAGLAAQLDHAIYSDDPDAIERLTEKIAGMEAERETMKSANAAYRKAHGAELRTMGAYERSQAVPHPAYELQNLGGNITRCRQRLTCLSGPQTAQPTTGDTATARAGLTVTAGMTTPSRPGKAPRQVWTVTGNFAVQRQLLIDLGGNWYRGAFSFWDDPTTDIETALSGKETEPRQTMERDLSDGNDDVSGL